MIVHCSVLEVAEERGTELTDDWLEKAAKVFTPEAIEAILDPPTEKIVSAARAIVRRTAKERTGALESAIGHHHWTKAQASGTYLTWDMTIPSRNRGKINRQGQTYVDKNGVTKAYPHRRKGGSGFAYYDNRGKGRHVDTVADYGRILEFSASRQLKHIALGAEEVDSSYGFDMLIEEEINALLDKAGL